MDKMNQDSLIEDYFLIGGLRSGALVSKAGSIDWLCLPYFDSPSIFAQLVSKNGGSFSIDTTGFTTSSKYITDTAIVETILKSSATEVRLHDFMVPMDSTNLESPQYLVRKLSCQKGPASISFNFNPQPDYARSHVSWQQETNQLVAECGEGWLVLHLPDGSSLKQHEAGYEISLELQKNDEKELILEYQPSQSETVKDTVDLERVTSDFWHDWISKGTFASFCRDNLVRSAITLKLLQFAPTGAIVAAPTTSLPEAIGGERNWDYRYVWIRDATFSLYAFHVLGYDDEAEQFFDFIEGVIEKCNDQEFDVSLMYTIFGEPVPAESTLHNLEGYKDSRPVRIGNGAVEQFQLDVYGALIDAVYFATKRGITDCRKDKLRPLVMDLVHKIEQSWQRPDSGIWEVRSGQQHFTYSKVMSWVGAERAMRLQDVLGFTSEDAAVCSDLADTIKQWIWDNCYSDETKNFGQFPGTDAADATNFLFVLLHFLDKHDPKTKEIISNTIRALCRQDVLVYRYLNDDGLGDREGAFVLCSFWLISALAIIEDTDESLRLFNIMESHLAPNGLIAEEIDVESGQYLGNYPQAFSHIGYIMSAFYLDKYLKRSRAA